jgi:hypothetical protein
MLIMSIRLSSFEPPSGPLELVSFINCFLQCDAATRRYKARVGEFYVGKAQFKKKLQHPLGTLFSYLKALPVHWVYCVAVHTVDAPWV